MTTRDLLITAGDAAERLEQHGLIACGRRENGVTRVDFWRRSDGRPHRHELTDESVSVDEVVSICLAIAGVSESAAAQRSSHLS